MSSANAVCITTTHTKGKELPQEVAPLLIPALRKLVVVVVQPVGGVTYMVTASLVSSKSMGLIFAISTTVSSVCPSSTTALRRSEKAVQTSYTTSICCKMQASVVALSNPMVLSPFTKPKCEATNDDIVEFKAFLFATESTFKAMSKASLDIFWLNMRWRPAMSTVAPGTVAPAAVAAVTYKVTNLFDSVNIGPLCVATAAKTVAEMGFAALLSDNKLLKVDHKPTTTKSWSATACVGAAGSVSAADPRMRFHIEESKRSMVLCMVAVFAVASMPLAMSKNSLDIF
mmetsp:Transcript_94318/g.305140  ORF Transcript_94318/g.305140 Transcript_94318/m.305140 type:complete len:286 (+) Transcript_94318:271-1128(+)